MYISLPYPNSGHISANEGAHVSYTVGNPCREFRQAHISHCPVLSQAVAPGAIISYVWALEALGAAGARPCRTVASDDICRQQWRGWDTSWYRWYCSKDSISLYLWSLQGSRIRQTGGKGDKKQGPRSVGEQKGLKPRKGQSIHRKELSSFYSPVKKVLTWDVEDIMSSSTLFIKLNSSCWVPIHMLRHMLISSHCNRFN